MSSEKVKMNNIVYPAESYPKQRDNVMDFFLKLRGIDEGLTSNSVIPFDVEKLFWDA